MQGALLTSNGVREQIQRMEQILSGRLGQNDQDSLKQATDVMRLSREQAHQTVTNTGKASESLSSITDTIHSMGSIINKITSAASSQKQQSVSMCENLDNISEISAETTTSSEKLLEVTEQLNQLSGQLQTMVGRFKV